MNNFYTLDEQVTVILEALAGSELWDPPLDTIQLESKPAYFADASDIEWGDDQEWRNQQ